MTYTYGQVKNHFLTATLDILDIQADQLRSELIYRVADPSEDVLVYGTYSKQGIQRDFIVNINTGQIVSDELEAEYRAIMDGQS